MTNLKLVRDYLYRSVVGILGPNGIDFYCFTQATSYNIQIAPGKTDDAREYFDSWGIVYEFTHGSPNLNCSNYLAGTLNADGTWANLIPAIAYAVEDNAIGADATWRRLTGADNFVTLENSGFNDDPMWGIFPRNIPNQGNIPLPPQKVKIEE
jgi:hypothetical protein